MNKRRVDFKGMCQLCRGFASSRARRWQASALVLASLALAVAGLGACNSILGIEEATLRVTGTGGSGQGGGGTGGTAPECTDEPCECSGSETQPCYTGPPATRDVGACHDGTQTCSSGGKWGQCLGDQTPAPEVCDHGVDNDCDPSTADGSADPLVAIPCDGPDEDLCKEGTSACTNGVVTCSDSTGDSLDVCDGEDNDCDPASPDGSEDPLNGQACDGTDGDLCDEGTWSCSPTGLVCSDNTGDSRDVCDGGDNDCDPSSPDGSEDQLLGTPCDGPDSDLCKEGGYDGCANSVLTCSDNTGDTLELCTPAGADEDCDGAVDEGCPTGPPAGWTCAANRYGDGTNCDCGCGAQDSDCPNLLLATCTVCNAAGSCSTAACPSLIAPTNNALCCTEHIVDGGFETGPHPNGNSPPNVWTERSLKSDTPICSVAACNAGGTGPHSGTYWAWFGGWQTTETGSLEQSVTIPVGANQLTFWFAAPYCQVTGYLRLLIDGTNVWEATNTSPLCGSTVYTQQTVNISAYANGAAHVVRFESSESGTNNKLDSFMVDDVQILKCP